MIHDFMRLILFFDLPVQTKEEKKVYQTFRKYLITNGYIMMQYSIYSKIFNNRDAAMNHIQILKKNCPRIGQVRIMIITEKQYANIEILVGGKSNRETLLSVDPFMLL